MRTKQDIPSLTPEECVQVKPIRPSPDLKRSQRGMCHCVNPHDNKKGEKRGGKNAEVTGGGGSARHNLWTPGCA